MTAGDESRVAASRIGATIFSFVIPVVLLSLYHGVRVGVASPQDRHAFEYGSTGAILVVLFVAVVGVVNSVGFWFACASVPPIDSKCARIFCAAGCVAGLCNWGGYFLVNSIGSLIVSESQAFWIVYYVGGTAFASYLVSLAILAILFGFRYLKPSTAG